MSETAFRLYLLFMVSVFLHVTERVEVLGTIRADLLMAGVITGLIILVRSQTRRAFPPSSLGKILGILFLYILVSLPAVRWPGTALHTGLPKFVKAVVFFYFTTALVTNEQRLRWFMLVFVACQTFRVIEPLSLHFLTGYWGSKTHMGGGEMMPRLAGAPSDIIGPNGLAFVIASVLPFLHYYLMPRWSPRVIYLGLLPLLIYALVLTASRSGFLALGIVVICISAMSRKRLLAFALVGAAFVLLIPTLSGLQKDRYLSLIRHDVRGSQTAQGRIQGVFKDFEVGLQRPVFGHGLGTSVEATAHELGFPQISHNLYTEIFQELGGVGVCIFLLYISAASGSIYRLRRQLHMRGSHVALFLTSTTKALQVYAIMNILFSFASYGLSSYEWYLLGGLSVVVQRLAQQSA